MHALYWEDNRLFMDDGTVWGVYLLPKLPYEHQSDAIKGATFRQLEVFFNSYHGKGQIISVTQTISPDVITDNMRKYSSHKNWMQHVRAVSGLLEQGRTFMRKTFLLVPLTSAHSMELGAVFDRPDLLKDRIREQGTRFVGYMKRRATRGRGIPILSEQELEAAKKAESRMAIRLQAMIPNASPATPHDIELLHRAPYFRGLPDIPFTLQYPLPRTVSMASEGITLRPHPLKLSLTSAVVNEDTFRVRVLHDTGAVSYQSVMAASTFLERFANINDEWIYQPLEHMEFPVDACIQFEITPSTRARDKVDRKKKIVRSQEEEYAKVGDVPWDVYDGLEDAQGLEAKLKSGMSLAEFHFFLAVGADSEAEMMHREEKLREKYDGVTQLVHPPGDALKLWRAFFPASVDGVSRSWSIPSDPQVLAASGLLGTMDIGDPYGQWFGYLAYNGTPVYTDWFRAMNELNRTGATAFCGTLGSGKSVGMKYAIDMMLSWGAIGVIIDPKQAEYASLAQKWGDKSVMWQFGAHSSLTFTPFRLGQTPKECQQIAEGFLQVLLNITTERDDQRAFLVIRRALERMYTGQRWDMERFLNAMETEIHNDSRPTEEREIADLFYEILLHYKDDPIGKAIFGMDDGKGGLQSNAQLIVVSTMGLDFPDMGAAADTWRESQRFSVAILYLVAQLGAKRIVEAPAHVRKFFAIDEAWLLRAIPEGRALMNRLILMGRSMNLVMMMAVQNVDVLLPKEENDDLSGSLGWIFVGRLTSEIQIKHATTLLRLPEGPDYVQKFQSFEKGRGFLRDPLGRVGEIQVEVLPQSLLTLYNTTPEQSSNLNKV